MPLSIKLSRTTFERHKSHAIPLEDTFESVIIRLLDAFEHRNEKLIVNGSGAGHGVRDFNPNAAPDLTRTKIRTVSFCGKPLGRRQNTWVGLLFAAVRVAKARANSPAMLEDLLKHVTYVDGERGDKDFPPVSGTGLSVRRRDANATWKAVLHIAEKLSCQVSVTFAWPDKEGAAHPGVTGRFLIPGK